MEKPLTHLMEIIPAIDLLAGVCVRLHQGDYAQVTRFNEDPVAQARIWQDQGTHLARPMYNTYTNNVRNESNKMDLKNPDIKNSKKEIKKWGR